MRENFYQITPDLLVKYLLGETTAEEHAQTEEWINAGEANRKEFNDFRTIWEASRALAVSCHLNEEESWQRFRRRIQSPAVAVVKIENTPPHRPALIRTMQHRLPFLRVAVLLLFIAGAAWLLRQWLPAEKNVSVRSYATVLSDTLPDGSVVTLNKNSALSYPGRFGGSARNVGLQGEAFFNVAPDKKKPFVIQVNDVTIKVVGTSFNVRSIRGHTQVIVETGIVQISHRRQVVELYAAERVDLAENDSVIAKQPVTDNLHNYYRSKEFFCNYTPLWKLAEVLEEAYGTRIIIARPALRTLPITTTFNGESLDTILDIISKTFKISYKKTADGIILQ